MDEENKKQNNNQNKNQNKNEIKREALKTQESNSKSESALREEKVLQFWKENKIFEKTLQKSSSGKEFIFYEGPPTANGKPGIHHLEARAFKDVIPRYKTMRGFHVRRKGGWDTHGLPVELQVEKKLGLNSKKAIEDYGIAKFNEECKESVWEYTDLWRQFTERIGYWVDQENPYITYHNSYIESVWNVIKKIDEQNLLYKDYKVVPWCPRCGTTLSSHELAQGYEIVKDLSVYAKFKVKVSHPESIETSDHLLDSFSKEETQKQAEKSKENNTYILAWTTTPWTLPGNVALAVGKDIKYIKAKVGEDIVILAENRVSILPEDYEILEKVLGSDLVGIEYEPLYPYFQDTISEGQKTKLGKAYKVYSADFVTTLEGTGVVHTAVMYGQDDFALGTQVDLPKHHLVGLDGKFVKGTGIFENRFVRDEEVAVDIIKDLAYRNLLFKKEKYEHSYPHCWRCHTALIYYARDSWYIKMSDPKIKEKLISENEKINWEPSHIREGRFGEWLREIKDWAISRERYWGTPLPVWTCNSCKRVEVIGSIEELKTKSKDSKLPINEKGELDLHRPYIDEIELKCDCGGILIRSKEVMDVWLDSGTVPFSQDHYPFENKEWIEGDGYPADFIAEAVDQTRGWFYTLHAVGILMGRGKAYKNVICLGHLLDANGKKMSKSLGNVVDPWTMIEKYGVDTLRLWMYSVNQPGESKNFDEKTVLLLHRQFFGLLYNILSFYELYKDKEVEIDEQYPVESILDKWIIERTKKLTLDVTAKLDEYKLLEPVRAIRDYIDELSTWYLRRSRERMKDGDKRAKQTLFYTLLELLKLLAPFAPFASEDMWLKLKRGGIDEESVHLSNWRRVEDLEKIDFEVLENMQKVREIVSLGLEARQKAGIKVRQVLALLKIKEFTLGEEYQELIKDELNVKEVIEDKNIETEVWLDEIITPSLKMEGDYRELVRFIQDIRKKLELSPTDFVILNIETDEKGINFIHKFEKDLIKIASIQKIQFQENDGEEIRIDELNFKIKLEK